MLSFDSVLYNCKNQFLEFIQSLSDEEQADIFAAIDKLLELKNSNQRIPEKLSNI